MKKDTVIWILIAVLFIGQGVLFTMQCAKRSASCHIKKACSYSQAAAKKECQACLSKTKKGHEKAHQH
ncbi:MAG: hypothetical protein ACI9BD_000253 [Candidatus Marinamargulisbacteria bacterium]|jgi:hypothetical protein